ncbi:MAG: hypothetical protein ACR2PF_16955 [Rhizobiaceae bacterium]
MSSNKNTKPPAHLKLDSSDNALMKIIRVASKDSGVGIKMIPNYEWEGVMMPDIRQLAANGCVLDAPVCLFALPER